MSETVTRELIELLDSQQEFIESPARYKVFCGPVGSGKSLAIIYQAFILAHENPGCMGLIGAPTYRIMTDTVIKEMLLAMDNVAVDNGINPKKFYTFYKEDHRLHLHECDSDIVFRPVDQFEKLRGLNLAWFGMDEMTLCKEEAFDILMGRLRDTNAQRMCGFGGCTPKGFDWVYDRFVKNERPDYALIQAPPAENIHLRDDYYSDLKFAYDERFYEQEALGKFVNLHSGQVYYKFDSRKHVTPLFFDKRKPICWSLDFNITPMCSVIGQIHDDSTSLDRQNGIRRTRLEIIDEIYLKDARTNQAAEEFASRVHTYGFGTLNVRVYGDGTGDQRQRSASAGAWSDWDTVKKSLGNAGIDASFHYQSNHNPAIKNRVAAVNGLLENTLHEVRLLVDPKCKMLIKDLERLGWQPGATATFDTQGNTLSHMSDALGYLIWQEFGLGSDVGFKRHSPTGF